MINLIFNQNLSFKVLQNRFDFYGIPLVIQSIFMNKHHQLLKFMFLKIIYHSKSIY